MFSFGYSEIAYHQKLKIEDSVCLPNRLQVQTRILTQCLVVHQVPELVRHLL